MKKNSLKIKSLIICTSPLQMTIAEKIIDLNQNNDFELIVITKHNNQKYRYYYNRLKNKCSNSFFYITSDGIKNYINFQYALYRSNFYKKFNEIYVASFDSTLTQLIISKHRNADIYTFDDGLANIVLNSHYYILKELPIARKLAWWLLGARLSGEKVKKLSLKHYTIYNRVPNIIENTEYIRLYGGKTDADKVDIKPSKEVRIYLGQPLYDYNQIFDNNYISDILNSLDIDLYFSHPKEKNSPKGEYDIINSKLIFEDYIINYLENNLDTNVYVYSFFSGCLLNISQLERVKVSFISNDFLRVKLKDFYSFSHDTFNIKSINID